MRFNNTHTHMSRWNECRAEQRRKKKWRPLELMHCFIVTRRFLLLLWSGEVLILARKYTALSNKATSICFWFLSNSNFYVAPQLDHSLSFTLSHFFRALCRSRWCSIKKNRIQMMWTSLVQTTEIENEKKKLQTKLATFRKKGMFLRKMFLKKPI